MNLKKIKIDNEKIISTLDILLPFIFGMIYLIWSRYIVIGGGDDEFMRYDIARYIYDNRKLPWVDDPVLCSSNIWGISYANRPMLSFVISAVFMWISAAFGYTDEFSLMYAARLTSVLSSVVTIIFLIKISEKIGLKSRYLLPICFGLIPEFAFLSGYVNSDSLAIMSVAMTIYFWYTGLESAWDRKSIIGITISLAICMASYQNVYGFILVSGILFLVSSFIISKNGGRKFSKAFLIGLGIIAAILVLSGWWYLRNAIHYGGDFSGREAMHRMAEQYAVPELKPSNKQSLYEQGVSVMTMLFPMGWISGSMYSVIGNFRIFEGNVVQLQIYSFLIKTVLVIIALGVIAYCVKVIRECIKHKSDKGSNIMDIHLLLGAFIVVLLSFIYSYFDDFQLAGRYIVPALIPVLIWFSRGAEYALKKFPPIVERIAFLVIVIIFSSLNLMSLN